MRRGRSNRGSALVITVMMLLVMIAFTSVLLSAPMNQLSKVGESSTKERAVMVADAGLRDAIQWLAANPSATELGASSPFTTSGMSSTTPTGGLATFTANSYYPQSTTTGIVTKYWDGQTYHDTNVTGSTAYYFIQKNFANGRYAWRVIRRDTSYYQVVALGLVTGGAGTQSPYTKIEAVLKKSGGGSLPAAASFMNQGGNGFTGGSNSFYDSQNGGSPPSINGTDSQGSGSNIPGVAIQNAGFGFGAGSGAVVGTPSAIVGGTSGNAGPTVAQWAQLQTLVDTIASGANGASNYRSFTYPTTISTNGGNGPWTDRLIYMKVPANTTVSGAVLTLNGVNNVSGVLVIDLGDNATISASELYNKNGTGYFQGAMIIIQRGRLNVGASGLHFINKNGNNANFLQYNSVAVGNALAPLTASTKIASYIVQ